MNKKVLIIRNIPRETPGILEELLNYHSIDYIISDFDGNTDIGSLKRYAAMIVLGGPESANDQTPKMLKELALIEKGVASGIPYLGICLGLQTLVKAMGGKVVKCQSPETGFRDREDRFFNIELTSEGRNDGLFEGLDDKFTVFQLHGETVQITDHMKLLATGYYCHNQIVKYGEKAYGIQPHFELTKELLITWIVEDPDLQILNANLLMSDFEYIRNDYSETGRRLFENFLFMAGLIRR